MDSNESRTTGRGSAWVGRLPLGGLTLLPVACVGAIYLWREHLGLQDSVAPLAYGGVSVAGLVLGLALCRIEHRAVRGLAMIRDVLRSRSSGDHDPGMLEVSGSSSPEMQAWRGLISELAESRAFVARASAEAELRSDGAGEDVAVVACDALWWGVVVTDTDGTVRYANGAAGILLGTPRDDLVGRRIHECGCKAHLAEFIGKALATGQRVTEELPDPNAQGTVIRVSVRRAARHTAVILEDVSQQRTADEARNTFVTQATHELRNPLTIIRLQLDLAAEEGEHDPAVRAKALNVIAHEALRLERIVTDMLSVSEIEAGTLKLRLGDMRMDAMMEELQSDFETQARETGVRLVFDLPPKLPVVRGDRDKVMLALHNVIGNAVKYTPAGGAVTVKCAESEGSFGVDVSDTGIGIAEGDLALVFDRFYRAKDPRLGDIPGSGLGLALAREVARLHGGDVTVQSELNKGSTFSVRIPMRKHMAA